MENTSPFYSNRKFYGDKYFRYGINRSGEFTIQQAELLMNHGWAYQALADGTRKPDSKEEQRFVAVCEGRKPAKTDHEKVWVLYNAKISSQHRGLRSASI